METSFGNHNFPRIFSNLKKHRHFVGDVPFTVTIKKIVLEQIKHSKECWNSARYAESVRNTLCALFKCRPKIIHSIQKFVKIRFPILAERHTVFNTEEALEADDEYNPHSADNWVSKFIIIS